MKKNTYVLLLLLFAAINLQAIKPITDRPKSRIGVSFQTGYGFQNIDMVTLENNTNYLGKKSATISFGGGTGMAINLGHEFSKHFDLSASLGSYLSTLTPEVSNATARFRTTRVSLTPAYIIPLRTNDRMRVKIGAGIDMNFANQLKLRMNELKDGFNDTWKYDRAIGFHINGLFEINILRTWSCHAGLQLDGINYHFDSGKDTFPTGSDLKAPNGSGINVIIGTNYCF